MTSRFEIAVTFSMPSPPAGPVPARISLRTSCGSSCTITWAIMPPMEKGEEVNLVETQRPDERNGVLRHRLDLVRRRTGGSADAPVVERDDQVLRGDAVD